VHFLSFWDLSVYISREKLFQNWIFFSPQGGEAPNQFHPMEGSFYGPDLEEKKSVSKFCVLHSGFKMCRAKTSGLLERLP
jgi:hypothetical protein